LSIENIQLAKLEKVSGTAGAVFTVELRRNKNGKWEKWPKDWRGVLKTRISAVACGEERDNLKADVLNAKWEQRRKGYSWPGRNSLFGSGRFIVQASGLAGANRARQVFLR
jgi:hypothetical protein